MMRTHRHPFSRLLLLLPVAAWGGLGCSPVAGFCAASAECDDNVAQFPFGLDFVGEGNDSVDVCTADQQGRLRALRANEEEECQEQADALEEYYACVADVFAQDPGDACDALVFGNDNPCDDELDDAIETQFDSGDRCSEDEE